MRYVERMSLREKILGELILASTNDSLHSSNFGKLTDEIIKLIDKWLSEYEMKFVLQEESEDTPEFKLAAKFHQGAAKRMKRRLKGKGEEIETSSNI